MNLTSILTRLVIAGAGLASAACGGAAAAEPTVASAAAGTARGDQPAGAVKPEMPESARRVPTLEQLTPTARAGLAAFLPADARVLDIEEGQAHGVVEVRVAYLTADTYREVIWEDTHGKILGGSEPRAIKAVVQALAPAASSAIEAERKSASIERLKIKHADKDDREYVHVHFLEADGKRRSAKVELDGRSMK